MPRLVLHADQHIEQTLHREVAALQAELGVEAAFPASVLAEAATVQPHLPELSRTDIEFVTIDPPGARDLDQALHIERHGQGFRVSYAIADVAAFVKPGGAIDAEARRRGETLYGVGEKISLHPPAIAEAAASLLPGVDRPAVLWTIDLDASGQTTDVDVTRALVRSRAKLSYAEVQSHIDSRQAPELFALLAEVGQLRQQREIDRGAVSLPLPDQEVETVDGRTVLELRQPLAVEGWNAQISLVTGMVAAQLMTDAGHGLLRTVPPADPRDVAKLKRVAKGLGLAWGDESYPQFIRSLDPARGPDQAMLTASTALLRGAGYVAFDGQLPEQPLHAAIASTYTHCTAPLRRLVDRFTLEVCLSHSAGIEVPQWAAEALPDLPELMSESARRASAYERGTINLVEAVVLAGRVGETFKATIVDLDERTSKRGDAIVPELAALGRVESASALTLGSDVRVRLTQADPATRSIRFEVAG